MNVLMQLSIMGSNQDHPRHVGLETKNGYDHSCPEYQ